MAEIDEGILIDLPEFGGLDQWEECLAELKSLPQTPEVLEAIYRCGREIAEIKGIQPPSMGDRWSEHGFSIEEAE